MDLEKILQDLLIQKEKLDVAIVACEDLFRSRGDSILTVVKEPGRRGRKSMGEKEREQVSLRMKRYWASRRKNKPADPK
jgi:hypothetical protein